MDLGRNPKLSGQKNFLLGACVSPDARQYPNSKASGRQRELFKAVLQQREAAVWKMCT